MIKKEFLYLGWYFLLCVPVIILYVNFSLKAKREWLSLIGRIKPQGLSVGQKREYIRLESAFPVEFHIEGAAEGVPVIVHQGFTKDISRTGIQIETFAIRGKKLDDFVPEKTKLKLIMNIPSDADATQATGTVKWINKSEDLMVDRYSIGVSFDEITDADLENVMKRVLWLRRKPDILGIAVAVALVLTASFFSAIFILNNEKRDLSRRLEVAGEERVALIDAAETISGEREELRVKLDALLQERAVLVTRLKYAESKRVMEKPKPAEIRQVTQPVMTEAAFEEPENYYDDETEEIGGEDMSAEIEAEEIFEEFLDPVVELRIPAKLKEDEIVVEPNITRKMIEAEKNSHDTLRDYILHEEVQLLDRYCSTHRTSIYHAAGLFALAEMRYKARSMEEMTKQAYRNVMRLYPRSKYASYASHRMDQLGRNMPYETRSLGYYSREYNLPDLFDYRELEPYKK